MTPEQLAAKLPKLIAKNKRDAMQRAVLTVEAAAKREAPHKSGNLRRSITSRVERGGDRGVIGTNAKYARAVHEGTRPRTIRPVRKRALFWRGARHPVKSVRHPGTRANPFLTRAMARSRGAVEKELAGWGNKVFGSIR